MKFMMIFEGVDRASKVMNKLAATEKKTAAATKAGARTSEAATNSAARASQRMVAVVSRLGSAARSGFNAVVSGAQAAGRAVVALHQKTLALGKRGFSTIGDGAGKAFRGVTLAAGIAMTAVGGASLAANSLVDVASQFQRYQTILETTEGSSAKAKAAMGWVSEFAVKTPYELDQVMDSFVKLRAYGLDPTKGLMVDLGNTAAAMGKPLEQAVEAIADAVTGENERLKEFGIKAAVKNNEIFYSYTINGQKKIAKALASDPAGIQAALQGIMRQRYDGAMDKLSRTWDGMISNLGDLWTKFQLAIMSAGLFDWMQEKLQAILGAIDRLQASGDFDRWAAKIGGTIQTVLQNTWLFATRLYSVLEKVGSILSAAATYVGGWENLAAILAGFAFAPTLIATAAGLVQIAVGLSMLSAALVANPIVLVIAAIAAGAIAIYANWDRISAFFADIWSSISAGAAAAWQSVRNWLGFDPVAALSAGWSALSTTISNWWNSLPVLDWDGMLPALSWSNVLTVLNWASWLHPLRWLDFVPGFSWAGIVSGALDWGRYITAISWGDYLPSFSWPSLPSFRWPDLPTFSWPALPALELPELPDIAGYISGFGDKAMAAIDAVSTRLGAAWSRVKSAFSFGEEAAANVTVTDPATIKAAAAATAALKADMQSVAAIDTSAAMNKLSMLDAAAKKVGQSVMSSIRQAQAFLGAVSFHQQGVALMDTLAAGIRARAAVVVEEIRKVTQLVRDHLPSSPAKTGPLSDIHRLKFTETIAGSIHPAPMVKAMRAAAAATMAAATLGVPAGVSAAAPVPSITQSAGAARDQVARASVARIAVQSQPRQVSSAPIVVNLKPQTTISVGDAADIKKQWDEMMRSSGRTIAELVDEEIRRRNRSSV